MDRTAALLAAVVADPDADEPRAIYADHLIDHSDPRGELIANQLAMAHGNSDRALKSSVFRLVQAHLATWAEVLGEAAHPKLERGFFARWDTTPDNLIVHAERAFAREPIIAVSVKRARDTSGLAAALVRLPPRIRELELPAGTLSHDAGAALLDVRGLRALDLERCVVSADRLAAIAREWGELRSLRLGYVPRPGLDRALAHARALVTLDLRLVKFDAAALDVLGELPALEALNLDHSYLDDTLAGPLVAGRFPALRVLRVMNTRLEIGLARIKNRFGDRVHA
jgi:uncharacterized protein (TIGR02996 family)